MDNYIELIKKSNNILIFTGAGISTNSGIPDFRSKNGLYSYAQEKYKIPYPEAIFDIGYFKKNPKPFFKLSRDLLSKDVKPTITHEVIASLEKLGKLEIVVTQNIDMLHNKSGNKKILSCHGTYETGKCLKCKKKYNYSDYKNNILLGEVPYCNCSGVIKPDITFFGENLPQEFYNFMKNPPKVDLVIVMGSSLEVQPANQLPLYYKGKAPLILVNMGKTVYNNYFDLILEMDCDTFSEEIKENI